jgi:hypothetical protein
MKKSFTRVPSAWLACLALCLTLAVCAASGGCAAQKQARSAEESGFLGDYSLLHKGAKGEALLNYKAPDADWASYKKVLLDPVVFYQKVEDPARGTPDQDIRTLVDRFSAMTYDELARDYAMVKEPGPGVMRIQIGLTHVQKSHAGLQTITSMIPVGLALTTTRNFVTGKPSFVGEATVEFRITDAASGRVLGLAVDRRVGGQQLKLSLDSWVDVNNILAQWSRLLRLRLCQLRGQADCSAP